VLAIVALRFVVGAHFFHEGYTKWRDPKPFSAPVFSAAKGPLADFYHGLAWDRDGLARLDESETYRVWGVSFPNKKDEPKWTPDGYFAQAVRHFGFNQDQTDEAAAALMARVRQYRAALDQHEADINEYFYGLERRQANASDTSRGLDSLRKHDARINSELMSKRTFWQSEIDKIWQGVEKDINDLADRSHFNDDPDQPRLSSRGYLKLSDKPHRRILDSETFDTFIPYFDMTIGALLIAGLFTRVSASLGAAFLASIIVSQWPFASGAMPTGYQQVEMCAMLVLATIGAGKYAGLDALLPSCCTWCCRGKPAESSSLETSEK
jgi:uncharacterized membrane protein YphA (DoxX/SURF4 family)